ncbi:hypothetical protein NARC_10390 [Candidatus Nitrosocosmicus arcticus]|uniref:Uncharacterized protein n=1 Tax=Candidatus Nitrosocosmicus arcticus TaxID=2035267 RepID=A0A557SZF4_9ARCH|nr:hypothetical protein NARC_10390 [Candidatus Nitrosocosmicus arcticus]
MMTFMIIANNRDSDLGMIFLGDIFWNTLGESIVGKSKSDVWESFFTLYIRDGDNNPKI